MERTILKIKNNPVYQELKAYYGQSTIFSTLGIERSENRHSAFLCWLLNPKSDHQLGVEALKKFLALYATASKNLNAELKAAFITGRYELESVETETEVALTRFCGDEGDDKQNRLDLWAEFSVVLPDGNGKWPIALVLENKIYSKEGKKSDLYQTEVYHNCLSKYYDKHILLETFLTPDAAEGPHCTSYVHLTYQQLLDDVLFPLSAMVKPENAALFINDYIRNLGKPAYSDDKNGDRMKPYSILATSALERNRLQQLLNTENMKTVIERALIAVYGNLAKDIVGKDAMKRNKEMNSYETLVLTDFWNDNIDILKAMLYNLDIFPESKKDAVDKIFKESRRDTTKYVVEREEGRKWVFADENYKKPLAKGRAACVFFSQWLQMQKKGVSLEDVKKAFPISINQYYATNKWDFLDSLIYLVKTSEYEHYVVNASGKEIRLEDDCWDFYPLNGRQCGWGYLKDNERAIMAKMWRTEDFQRLLDHIKANPKLFSGLRIRQI